MFGVIYRQLVCFMWLLNPSHIIACFLHNWATTLMFEQDSEILMPDVTCWNLIYHVNFPLISYIIEPKGNVYCIISINSSVTGHSNPWREDFDDLSQVTTAIEEMDRNFWHLQRSFYCLLLTPQKSVQRDGQDVPPHLRYWRDAHLFVEVTGHKGWRVGQNGTVCIYSSALRQCL